MLLRENASGVFNVIIDGLPDNYFYDSVPLEVFLTESILTPILSTSLTVQDPIWHEQAYHGFNVKNYDDMRGKNMIMSVYHPNYETVFLETNQVVYRMEKRDPSNLTTENYTLRACDVTLLNNQISRVSKFYKSKTPSDIVNDVLGIVGSTARNVEEASPKRDYDAQNKHPFQIINDQADYALAAANDPSFLHFMTYENGGTHHFRSLKEMTKQSPTQEFTYSQPKGTGLWENNTTIIKYNAPCDFDLLTDLMNGYPGKSSVMTTNPVSGKSNVSGDKGSSGFGFGFFSSLFTNKGTEDHSETTKYEDAQKYRKARLSLIEVDKIAINFICPLNVAVHAGQMIKLTFPHKFFADEKEYGSGDYLVVSVTHNIKSGGFGTTTIDCVSRSVGEGII